MCYQHIKLKVFEECLKEHMRREGDAVAKTDDITELTYEEENAIHYMGGYVIRKLQNSKRRVEVDFLILDQAAVSTMESSNWINLIDRGGLVHI